MSVDQVEAMLTHALRIPVLFALANEHLPASAFASGSEAHLIAVWKAAVSLASQHGAGILFDSPVKARQLVEVETKAIIDADEGGAFSNDYLFGNDPGNPGLIQRMFDPAYQEGLAPQYGKDLLCKFLHERTVSSGLRRAVRDADKDTITNLDEIIAQVKARAEVVEEIRRGPPSTIAADWSGFEERLQIYRGRELVGLRTGMTELDARTLGLRGLLVLGAGPGVGKTTYGLQLGLGVCKHNADAVFLMISLEMDRWAMYTRLLCNLAQLDWKTVMLGSESCRKSPHGPWFTPADLQSLELARAQLKDGPLGQRVLVVDRAGVGDKLTAASVQRLLNGLKQQCGAKRGLVVIDYIQRIPVCEAAARRGDLEADRYRVQVVQDVAEATKTPDNPAGDAILVISETRKPSGQNWHSKLTDLMGSARLPYAVDAALLYRPMTDDEEVAQYSWPSAGVSCPSIDELNKFGIAPVRLEIAKGRDGMQQGAWALAFHYQQSRFVEAVPSTVPAGSFLKGAEMSVAGPFAGGASFDPGTGIDPFS